MVPWAGNVSNSGLFKRQKREDVPGETWSRPLTSVHAQAWESGGSDCIPAVQTPSQLFSCTRHWCQCSVRQWCQQLMCQISSYLGGWSQHLFYKYWKAQADHAKPQFQVGTSFLCCFLVASPAGQTLLDGPKGAAVNPAAVPVSPLPSLHTPPITWDMFSFLFLPFVLTQTPTLPPK